MPKKKDTAAFEPSITRLEEIVRLLEEGSLSLEESLSLYEEGVALSRRCLDILDRAERKVEALSATGDEAVPFQAAGDTERGE